ncbi:hypothetical protein DFH27DRAFT_68263 [Peziza echinospora]|nr:hypothetical protein DFH27DRAFT_68263 [Peziza echinospora]
MGQLGTRFMHPVLVSRLCIDWVFSLLAYLLPSLGREATSYALVVARRLPRLSRPFALKEETAVTIHLVDKRWR